MKKILFALLFSINISIFSMDSSDEYAFLRAEMDWSEPMDWSRSDRSRSDHRMCFAHNTDVFKPYFDENGRQITDKYGSYIDEYGRWRYIKPDSVNNENHLFGIPNELLEMVLLRAGHDAGRNLLATCKSLHEQPYKLDCPEFAIELPIHGENNTLELLATNRLVIYKNPLKVKVVRARQNNFDSFCAALGHGINIYELHVENIDEKFTNALSENRSITTLNLCGWDMGPNGLLLTMFMTNPTLKNLNLDKTNIKQSDIAIIAQHLRNNTTLTSLSLKDNDIGSNQQNADLLSDALKTNNTLTELHVDNNELKHTGAVKFAECLAVNTTLKKLGLRNNDIWILGARALAPYNVEYDLDGKELLTLDYSKNRSITTLNLCSTDIGSNGLLLDMFMINLALTNLNLNNNRLLLNMLDNINIGSNGLLLNMFMINPTLKNLSLDNTNIKQSDIAIIAQHLRNNTTLTSLSLKDNDIGSNQQNADLLSDALKTNNTLTELHVDNNGLNYTGAVKFAECLAVNTTLKKLGLRNNNIGIYGVRALAPYNVKYNLDGKELLTLAIVRTVLY